MTDLTDDEATAQLRGAVTALDALLRPAFKSIDSLADRPHSKAPVHRERQTQGSAPRGA